MKFNLTPIIYIVIGVIMLIAPGQVSNIACYALATIILIFAINQVLKFAKDTTKNFTLVLGILASLLGFYIMFNPESFASFIPTVAGIIIIVDSSIKLFNSFDLKKAGYEGYKAIMISSIIILAFGLFLVFNPFGAVEVIIIMIGVLLIANGVLELISSNANKHKNEIQEAEVLSSKKD